MIMLELNKKRLIGFALRAKKMLTSQFNVV